MLPREFKLIYPSDPPSFLVESSSEYSLANSLNVLATSLPLDLASVNLAITSLALFKASFSALLISSWLAPCFTFGVIKIWLILTSPK